MTIFAADSTRFSASCTASRSKPAPIEQALLGVLALAVLALLMFPAARGTSEALGWLPFWLMALPGSAWAALRLRRWREEAAAAPASMQRARVPRVSAQVHRLRPPQARRVMAPAAERARAA